MFDRLVSAFSSLSLPRLAKAVTARLAAQGARSIVYDEPLKEIRAGAANALPTDYASARSRILPIVRQAADDALALLMVVAFQRMHHADP